MSFLERLILKGITNENKFIELIENYCQRLKYTHIRHLFNEENDIISGFRDNLHKIEFINFLSENHFPKLEQI